jgi:hypothetical protein
VARARRGELPLNKYRSGDQQGKKDRQQYRRNEPLANTELVDISHIGPPFCSGGSAALSVTDNSRGTRGDMGDMVAVRRITSASRNLLVASRVVFRFQTGHFAPWRSRIASEANSTGCSPQRIGLPEGRSSPAVDLICAAAAGVHVRGSSGSYDLVAADL